MKKIHLFLTLSCLYFIGGFQTLMAQSNISGKIADESGKPLQYVNVLLLRSVDSAYVKGLVSDSSGGYSFKNMAYGKYVLSYSFIGIEPHFNGPVETTAEKSTIDLGQVKLKSADKQLHEVVVAAKRPIFEQKIDRTVINIKNSITDVSGSALDVLAKAPGILVNRQNNSISIFGKTGVMVMINGKVSYLPMEAVTQLLAGTSAGNIQKIEVITAPPSKYNAEGNAGIINIVLVNNPNTGLNGSYFLTAGYGKRETPSAGGNFNYRNGRINLFGDYSFSRNHQLQVWDNFRQTSNSGILSEDATSSHRNAITQVHNLRLGADYQPDSLNIVGVLLGGYNSNWKMLAHNTSILQKNNTIDTAINGIDSELNNWQNIMANLNFQHTFRNKSALYFDANYVYYKDNNPNVYANNYYNGAGDFQYEQDSRTGKLTPINFKVFSSDYVVPIGKKITLETGAKISLSRFNNSVYAQRFVAGGWVDLNGLSANYLLKEDISAAYASLTDNLSDKTTLKAGLRYEYTTSNLGTTEIANVVNRKYGELFPTFYVSHRLNSNNSLNFSYSRRITRPTFDDLAPFTLFLDPKTYFTGNPALQPATADAIQASYLHNNLILSLSYTHEDNTIRSLQNSIDTANNIQYISAANFKYQQYFTVSVSLPLQINEWWSMQDNFTGRVLQVNTVLNGSPRRLNSVNFNLNSSQRFKITHDFSLELSGYYISGSYYGTQKYKGVYQADLGLLKKFTNKKDALRFAINDVFNSGGLYSYADNLSGHGVIRGSYNYGLVAYKITYTHNFGNNSLKEKRERSTSAEDELNRVHK